MGGVDGGVLGRIAKILSYVKLGAGKKLKKKERDEAIRSILSGDAVNSEAGLLVKSKAAATPAAGGRPAGATAAAKAGVRPVDDEEDDIFGDAGTEYKPTVKKTAVKKEQPAATGASGPKPAGGYFGTRDEMLDLPRPRQQPAAAIAGGGGEEDMDIEDGELGAPAGPQPPPGPSYPQPGQPYAPQYMQGQYANAYMDADQYAAYIQGTYGAAAYGEAGASGYGQAYPPPPGTYPSAPPVAQPSPADRYAADDAKWRVKRNPALGTVSLEDDEDAYAECFPDVGGFAGEVLDSDEEDLKKMDGQAANGKSR